MLTCVVVLAGGGSRRLGRDKLAVRLAGVTVLDRLLDGLERVLPAVPVVVVGRARVTQRAVTWLVEDPPGGGPVAGLARALDQLADQPEALVAVVAGDQPFAAAAVHRLAAAAAVSSSAAVVAADAAGVMQPLLGVYRCGALRAAIGSERSGRSMRSVLARLDVTVVEVDPRWCIDVDTAADVRAARRVAEHFPTGL
jgi:molybdenum cofactor guanylyltransferase